MTTTLKDQAQRILDIGGLSPSEIEIVSCDAKDPARTDDDVCVVREKNATRQIAVDQLFSLSNLRNLERGIPRKSDYRNYFFRLDPNLVLIRQGSATEAGFMDDGILYRAPGTLEWQRLDYRRIEASPAVKAAILSILRRTVSSRSDYDRLNAGARADARVDYDYARTKAVSWLVNLAPKDDAETSRVLLQSFSSLNPEGASLASFCLKGTMGSLPPEEWSFEPVVRPQFAWEAFGAFYAPLPLRRSPGSGEKEPVGSYTAAGVGAQLCIGPRVYCARREGLRIGVLGEVARMLNGFGYWSFGGKIFIGNENVVGFAEAAANLYPTGGFPGEGEPGEFIFKQSFGAGLRVIPHLKYFPLAIPVGFRLDPTDPKNSGIYIGLGGAQ